MAITPLDDLLAVDTLTGMIKTFSEQGDNRSCTALFARNGRPLIPLGDAASWDEVEFSRHLAPVTGEESPHTRANLLKTTKRSSTMAYVRLYKDLPASHLFLNRAPGSDMSDAEAILATELLDLANLIANTKEFLACGALLGLIDVNPATVPGSEISFKVDFGNAMAQAMASWADKATPLRSSELIELKRKFKEQSGLSAEIAITEPGVEGWLVANDELRQFAKEPLALMIIENATLEGVNPQWERLAGLSFRFTDGTYKPQGGPVTRYFPAGKVLVLPGVPRLNQVLGWAEGKVYVPAGPVYGDAARATSMIREMRGSYAYAEVRTDPMGIRIYAGWHGLPVVLNPNAVMVFDALNPAAPAPAPAP
ncbi:MAG: major capsid protein [Planctomycetota bacterium]